MEDTTVLRRAFYGSGQACNKTTTLAEIKLKAHQHNWKVYVEETCFSCRVVTETKCYPFHQVTYIPTKSQNRGV